MFHRIKSDWGVSSARAVREPTSVGPSFLTGLEGRLPREGHPRLSLGFFLGVLCPFSVLAALNSWDRKHE